MMALSTWTVATNETGQRAILWPTRENYERFRAACDDILPAKFDDFMLAIARQRKRSGTSTDPGTAKVDFDPDAMADWCRQNFGRIDATARRCYAAFLLHFSDVAAQGH